MAREPQIRLISLCIAIGLAWACDRTDDPASPGRNSLRVAIVADEATLQPYTHVTGYPGWNMLTLVYDTLFVLDLDNQPRPWVALADRVSADGLTHTLTLRSDVRWHDGRPLTSADVRFSYQFYQAHLRPRYTSAVQHIIGLTTPDATTVVVTLRAPDPSFERRLLADVPIIPEHVWHGVSDPKSVTTIVGSGPFRLVEYRPDVLYRFVKHPGYFGGAPQVDELVMPVIEEPSTVFSALETGEIHATTEELPAELIPRFATHPVLRLARGPGYSTTLLQFNTERAPWNDARVRRAVALAIDTRALVQTVLLGNGIPGHAGWFHPTLPWHDQNITSTHDPAAARRVLDEAGLVDRDGDGIREAGRAPLTATLLVQANQPERIRAAELIARAVRNIGIDVRVRAEDATSVIAKVWPDFDVSRGRNFDWAMFGWSPPVMSDPLRIVGLVHSNPIVGNNNIGGFRHPEMDALGDRLSVTTDLVQQQNLLHHMERLIARERPFVMLWYGDLTYAYNGSVYDGWRFQTGHGIFHKQSLIARAPR